MSKITTASAMPVTDSSAAKGPGGYDSEDNFAKAGNLFDVLPADEKERLLANEACTALKGKGGNVT